MREIQEKTELAKLIRERRAVKKGYNNKKVTEETVLQLLNDAVWAPTHGLRQPWRFVFVDSEQKPDFAKKVADETYTKLDYVKEMNTNKVPSKGGYTIKNGSILDAKGRIIDGLTESLGKGNSAVYLSKSTFVSMDQLKMTIGHEYIHATHNFMASRGILNANAKHEGILWTEISAHHWENHVWGVQNGYGIYERQLGRFHWWRKDYFGWLLNAKY